MKNVKMREVTKNWNNGKINSIMRKYKEKLKMEKINKIVIGGKRKVRKIETRKYGDWK